jgi:hypothetical protein
MSTSGRERQVGRDEMACVSYESAFSNKRQKRRFLGFETIAAFCCDDDAAAAYSLQLCVRLCARTNWLMVL